MSTTDASDDANLVPALTAPLSDAKELAALCRAEGIEVDLARDACCGRGGCGCAPKLLVLAPRGDLPRIATLLRDRWSAMLEREGVDAAAFPATEPHEGEHPACPACGTAAALVEGACSDCGLQLE